MTHFGRIQLKSLGKIFGDDAVELLRGMMAIRRGSFSVWPSTLYEKMSITGEKELAPATSDKLVAVEERPDRGMLFIIGAPRLPKEEARKTYTANTLMVNTADHPSYYDLQVEQNYNAVASPVIRK